LVRWFASDDTADRVLTVSPILASVCGTAIVPFHKETETGKPGGASLHSIWLITFIA
jgi:hypothetical protein